MKEYLGDGAYIEIEEWGDIVLTTEDGVSVTNRIVLDNHALAGLLRFLNRVGVDPAVLRYLNPGIEPKP